MEAFRLAVVEKEIHSRVRYSGKANEVATLNHPQSIIKEAKDSSFGAGRGVRKTGGRKEKRAKEGGERDGGKERERRERKGGNERGGGGGSERFDLDLQVSEALNEVELLGHLHERGARKHRVCDHQTPLSEPRIPQRAAAAAVHERCSPGSLPAGTPRMILSNGTN